MNREDEGDMKEFEMEKKRMKSEKGEEIKAEEIAENAYEVAINSESKEDQKERILEKDKEIINITNKISSTRINKDLEEDEESKTGEVDNVKNPDNGEKAMEEDILGSDDPKEEEKLSELSEEDFPQVKDRSRSVDIFTRSQSFDPNIGIYIYIYILYIGKLLREVTCSPQIQPIMESNIGSPSLSQIFLTQRHSNI